MSFACSGCHKTWPDAKNQTPDIADSDTCPDCYDDEAEREPTQIGSKTYFG